MSPSFSGSSGADVSESVSVTVVNAVATHRDVDPTELPPLYEWIDPDALDDLFASTRRGRHRRGRLSFTYDGHEIGVDFRDEVSITVDGSPVVESVTGSENGFLSSA